MSLDPSADYLLFDGTAAATWTQAGTGLAVEVAHALRREVKAPLVPGTDGTPRVGDVWWSLSVAELATRPGAGDTITDAGGRVWTLLEVCESTLSTRWKCRGRDLILANNLREMVVVEYATESKDASGALYPTWAVLSTQPGRIQPTESDAVDEHGQLYRTQAIDVYLLSPVAVHRKMRVRGANGAVYNVGRTRGGSSIEDLMILEAEPATWPSA